LTYNIIKDSIIGKIILSMKMMKNVLSVVVAIAPSMGLKKLGQPVPESNLSVMSVVI
jgi:hypothetical protein